MVVITRKKRDSCQLRALRGGKCAGCLHLLSKLPNGVDCYSGGKPDTTSKMLDQADTETMLAVRKEMRAKIMATYVPPSPLHFIDMEMAMAEAELEEEMEYAASLLDFDEAVEF